MKNKIKLAVPELLSRLTIGLVFAESGWGKFQDLQGVTEYFESLNIPLAGIQAPFVSGVELMAGILVLLGLFTRLSTVPLIVIMIVAIATAKSEDVTGLSSLFGLSEFLYIVILTWLLVNGSKFLSLDNLVCRFMGKGTCKS